MLDNNIIACYVCRHGRTVLNAEGKFRGNKDVELDSTGIADAHRLANLFSNIEISGIFCSDKIRATKTAEIIAQANKLPITLSKNLRALNVGDFSGQPRNKENEAELQKYIDDPCCCIPGGESLNDFRARVRPCIQDAVDLYMDCGVPPLIVGHSSIIHEVGAMLHGEHKSVLVEPGGAIAIYFNGKGQLAAQPIFKPVRSVGSQAETIS